MKKSESVPKKLLFCLISGGTKRCPVILLMKTGSSKSSEFKAFRHKKAKACKCILNNISTEGAFCAKAPIKSFCNPVSMSVTLKVP